jgi:toxin YhaV
MVINGWAVYAHPLLLGQTARLRAGVERDRRKSPANYQNKSNAKLLNAIRAITRERVPQDPTDKRYRLGNALGNDHKHWFREKFGNGRFRLFFRFDTAAKIIIYGWMNDETTLRTYGSKSDAYAVFAAMLDTGHPPDDWETLLAECTAPDVVRQAEELLTRRKDE